MTSITSNSNVFAAVCQGGSVVAWGDSRCMPPMPLLQLHQRGSLSCALAARAAGILLGPTLKATKATLGARTVSRARTRACKEQHAQQAPAACAVNVGVCTVWREMMTRHLAFVRAIDGFVACSFLGLRLWRLRGDNGLDAPTDY